MKPTQKDGVELCRKLYPLLKEVGIFPAITGGLLYKDGERKDIDILLYRHRQERCDFEVIDLAPLLSIAGVIVKESFGFVTKAEWKGFEVDIFNPETKQLFDEEYGEE